MSDYDFECGTCGKTFAAGWQARDNHCNATGHRSPAYECDTCARYFGSANACHQHMNDKNHFAWKCTYCDETWPSQEDRNEHEDDEHGTQDFECDTCYRTFGSQAAANQHMDALNHYAHECQFCDETWPTEDRCNKHERDDHHFCKECDRTFQNQNNLRMHLNSRIHRGNGITCPFCKKGFTTAAGLTTHLESAGCESAPTLNRDTIFRIVRHKDPNGRITKNLLEWHGSVQYEATPKTWNGSGYECYLCHHEFRTLPSLNQHLTSPRLATATKNSRLLLP